MVPQMYMRTYSPNTAYWVCPMTSIPSYGTLCHFDDVYTKLWEAVRKFDRSCFKQLAVNLPLVQVTDAGLNSILHCAAAVGNADIIAYVLRKPMNSPPVNAINSHGYSALQKALMKMKFSTNPGKNFRETVRLLLEAGADPRLPHTVANGLVTASDINCPVTINMLYSSMVQREPCKMRLMLWFKNAGWALRHFMWMRDLQLLKLFIDSDRSILDRGKGSLHPLNLALEARVPATFFELLVDNYHVDPNYRDSMVSSTPLHRLCEFVDERDVDHDVMEKLLELGANPNIINQRGQNCLHLAAKAGSDRVVKLLLKYNVQTDTYDLTGKNAMHYAAISGSKEVIATLHGAGLSALEKRRMTPRDTALHLASYYCRPEAVAYLIRLGVNPNELDCNGMTPMHYALMVEDLVDHRKNTVDVLVDYGANLYHDDDSLSQLKYCLKRNLRFNATLITRHLALAQSRDPELTTCIIREIMEDQKLKKVYDDCLVELEAMKKYEVFGWASMHTILTAPLKVIRPLMRNSDVVKAMYRCIIDRIIHQKFPIYCSQIIDRFSRYEKEQRRVNFACEGLSDLLGHWDLNGIIAKNVVKFLGEDIDALVDHRIDMTAKNILKCHITDN